MTDPSNISLKLYAQTDVGMVRSGNEDNFLILDLSTGQSWTASDTTNETLLDYTQGYYGSLLAVSDGMGGALAGEVASRMAVETVRDRMLQLQAHRVYRQIPFHERLRLAIEEANLLINGESISNPEHKGLGATFTAAAAQGNRIYFAQVGDSRAYLIRQGKIIRITKDQSLVQQLIDAGQITEEEAETHSYRNVILQALGAHSSVNVEVNWLQLCQSDTLVLCSDGLSGKVRADEIARLVQSSSDLNTACQSLISLANERGGEDNITVVIVQYEGIGLPAPSLDPIEPAGMARQSETPTELNWDTEADTDPMNNEGSTEDLNGNKSEGTEPLPDPPSSLFPTAPNRSRRDTGSGTQRNTEQIGTTEPTTMVVRISDLDEYLDEGKRSSNESGAALTPEGDPLAPAYAARMHDNQPTDPSLRPIPEAIPGGSAARAKNEKSSRLALLALLIFGIGVAALGGAFYYFNYYAPEQKQTKEEAERKQRIVEMDERLVKANEKLTAVRSAFGSKPIRDVQQKEKFSEDLNKVSKKYEQVRDRKVTEESTYSKSVHEELRKECDDIMEELGKLEEKLKELSSRSPVYADSRYPVTC
jgi:serine/threonine protein phosphatase PrpC/flagellar basal body-associated protein FliL